MKTRYYLNLHTLAIRLRLHTGFEVTPLTPAPSTAEDYLLGGELMPYIALNQTGEQKFD